jgi:hypothetical protein
VHKANVYPSDSHPVQRRVLPWRIWFTGWVKHGLQGAPGELMCSGFLVLLTRTLLTKYIVPSQFFPWVPVLPKQYLFYEF